MDFQIVDYRGAAEQDREITSLLTQVFVGEGYTDKQDAEKMFAPAELKKRGEIILAVSAGELAGMIILVFPKSPARQVARMDEAEIHLLAVNPKARGKGIAPRLIAACEQRALSSGYSKMVLSTQPTMERAHRVYERLGYHRNATQDWSKGAKTYRVYEKSL